MDEALHEGAAVGSVVLRREARRTPFGSLWLGHDLASRGRRVGLLLFPRNEGLERELIPRLGALLAQTLQMRNHAAISNPIAVQHGASVTRPHIVLEFPGEVSLAELERQRRAQEGALFSTDELRWIAAEVGDALIHVHRSGLRHGALSAEHIWLSWESGGDVIGVPLRISELMLELALDRDVSLRMRADPDAWSQEMRDELARRQASHAPELLGAAEPTERSDLYALAAIIYRLSTGVGPIPGPNLASPATGDLALDVAICRALELDPARRFDSIADFLIASNVQLAAKRGGAHKSATAAVAEDEPTGMRTVELTPFERAAVASMTERQEWKEPATRRGVAVAVGGWVLVLGLGAVWYVSQRTESPLEARVRVQLDGVRNENEWLRTEIASLKAQREPASRPARVVIPQSRPAETPSPAEAVGFSGPLEQAGPNFR